MNRWELDKELDRLKQQGFSEEQAYCIIACMEWENENEQELPNGETLVWQNKH